MSGDPQPKYPRVRGDYQMTKDWRISLPDEYAKRFEKSPTGTDLVLWRPGITCWITVYGQKKGESPDTSYEWRKSTAPSEAEQVFEFRQEMPFRYGYLVSENPPDDPSRLALYTFTFGHSGHVLMAIYLDSLGTLDIAKSIWMSLSEKEV